MWYYSTNGTQRGPFTDKEFLREVNDGLIEPDTLVWNDELNEWREAQNVPGLLTPEEVAPQPGAGLREAAEYGMFRNERHWNGSNPPPPAGSNAAQEARYKNSSHYEPNPSLFSFRGRLGRLKYFLLSFVLTIVLFAAYVGGLALVFASDPPTANHTMITLGIVAATIVFITGTVVGAFITVKRLHDLNLSGWFFWVHLIPFANFLFALYLLFVPGTDGPNRYGPKPS